MNQGQLKVVRDTGAGSLLHRYRTVPREKRKKILTADFEVTVPTTAIRIPGVPDLMMDRLLDPETVRWASIGTDGVMTVHHVVNRVAQTSASMDRENWDMDAEVWIQWPLLMALYDEALDPDGRHRGENGGYDPHRLKFHEVGRLGGYVIELRRRGDEPPVPNRVASRMVRHLGSPELDLVGTVAWVGDSESRLGEPHGYDTLDDEQIGTLSGLALTLRRDAAADGPEAGVDAAGEPDGATTTEKVTTHP
jgi:hypothetical protein